MRHEGLDFGQGGRNLHLVDIVVGPQHGDALPLFLDAPSQSPIFRVRGTDLPPLESRDPFRHEHIEFMEVDVGQDWRDDTALRSAAVGPGVNPVFHNTRLKHAADQADRSEEHTSELQSLMRISYAVFCLKKKKKI